MHDVEIEGSEGPGHDLSAAESCQNSDPGVGIETFKKKYTDNKKCIADRINHSTMRYYRQLQAKI